MKRPPIEVADIIRAVGRSFIDKHQSWLTGLHRKVLSAIERCRTAALGGHKDRCTRCGYTAAISYNSCLMESVLFWGVAAREPTMRQGLRWCCPPHKKSHSPATVGACLPRSNL
jgi:transposase-like zinc-binding protein